MENDRENKEKVREKDYAYALKYRREYYNKVIKIAKIWDVRLMAEEELPPYRKNVIKCEDKNSAFHDLKRREYFQNLDMTKVELQDRMKVIRNVLYTLDLHHKQTL
jgi:hypothetical protein